MMKIRTIVAFFEPLPILYLDYVFQLRIYYFFVRNKNDGHNKAFNYIINKTNLLSKFICRTNKFKNIYL